MNLFLYYIGSKIIFFDLRPSTARNFIFPLLPRQLYMRSQSVLRYSSGCLSDCPSVSHSRSWLGVWSALALFYRNPPPPVIVLITPNYYRRWWCWYVGAYLIRIRLDGWGGGGWDYYFLFMDLCGRAKNKTKFSRRVDEARPKQRRRKKKQGLCCPI